VTAWQPAGQDPVIFVSRQSTFAPGKPIRGGIPVVFPWFAIDTKKNRVDGHPGPMHGFARVQDWTLVSARRVGDDVALQLTLGPTEMSRSMGYDHFLLTLDAVIGAELDLRLTVASNGTASLPFEQAFHTYFWIVDVHETTVAGLEPTPFIDKTDNFKMEPAAHAPIRFTAPTDRVYENTDAPLTIHDGTQRRDIHVTKTNSHTTVVWNPGKPAPEIGEWDWHEFVCVETVNAAANAQTLAPGKTFTMGSHVRVEKWRS
jgi:glucose-6-phosphate 1-epimerase